MNDYAVTAAVWAESEGAARRAVLQQLEADESKDSRPPEGVLLRRGLERYGGIREAGRTGSSGNMLEAASYRGRDGLFIDRRINFPRWTFHFRGGEDDDAARCYAVEVRLPDELHAPCDGARRERPMGAVASVAAVGAIARASHRPAVIDSGGPAWVAGRLSALAVALATRSTTSRRDSTSGRGSWSDSSQDP